MGRLSDFADSFMTGTRGFGEGATLGLIKYPQAALTTLVNGGNYTQNLSDLRKQNEQLAQQDPVAWYGGELGGGVVTGALTGGYGAAPKILGGAGKALNLVRAGSKAKAVSPIVTNAAMGAVEGATQNDYTTPTQLLKDVATGAVTSGAIAGLGEGARVGLKKIGSHWVENTAVPFLKETGTPGATPRKVVEGLKQFPTSDIVQRPFQGGWQSLKDIAKSAAVDAGYGAAVGAGGAALTGNDVTTGALLGAGTGVAIGKQQAVRDFSSRAAQAAAPVIARNPLWVSNPIRTAYYTAGPEAAGAVVNATSEKPTDWSQYSVQPEAQVDWTQYTTKQYCEILACEILAYSESPQVH